MSLLLNPGSKVVLTGHLVAKMEAFYINWSSSPYWSANLPLGQNGELYKFSASWNTRNKSWAVSISKEGSILMKGVKLVLGVDLLTCCHSKFKPECILYPATENKNIHRVDFENMVSGDVKLYCINLKDLGNDALF